MKQWGNTMTLKASKIIEKFKLFEDEAPQGGATDVPVPTTTTPPEPDTDDDDDKEDDHDEDDHPGMDFYFYGGYPVSYKTLHKDHEKKKKKLLGEDPLKVSNIKWPNNEDFMEKPNLVKNLLKAYKNEELDIADMAMAQDEDDELDTEEPAEEPAEVPPAPATIDDDQLLVMLDNFFELVNKLEDADRTKRLENLISRLVNNMIDMPKGDKEAKDALRMAINGL